VTTRRSYADTATWRHSGVSRRADLHLDIAVINAGSMVAFK
jgi:hypothetical protein